MSIQTDRWPTEALRFIYARSQAGVPNATIAKELDARGTPVPRQDLSVTGFGTRRAADPYALDTMPGYPSLWTAQAVAQVLAAPECDPTNNWAAAQAKAGSDAHTTLTIA